MIEEVESIYRDIQSVKDYGGYTAQELFRAKLCYLETDRMPRLRGSALLSKLFGILGDIVILLLLVVIDGLLLFLLFLLYTKNDSISYGRF